MVAESTDGQPGSYLPVLGPFGGASGDEGDGLGVGLGEGDPPGDAAGLGDGDALGDADGLGQGDATSDGDGSAGVADDEGDCHLA
jgi:hypothetical protein